MILGQISWWLAGDLSIPGQLCFIQALIQSTVQRIPIRRETVGLGGGLGAAGGVGVARSMTKPPD